MVLVDTSVWVSHFRDGNSHLEALLQHGDVACHPFIIGELACGRIKNRSEILSLLQSLPMAEPVDHDETLKFIESNRLMGIGLGFIDVHLLAVALLTGATLWTLDKRLEQASSKLKINFTPH